MRVETTRNGGDENLDDGYERHQRRINAFPDCSGGRRSLLHEKTNKVHKNGEIV